MHAPGGHALMDRFDNYCHTKGLKYAVYTGGNFSGHLFLNLKALCIDIDKSGELRNSNDPFAWEIADMGSTNNWSKVMFAMRLEGNVSQHDHLIIACNLVECSTEVVAWVLGIAGEPFFIRLDNPSRRAQHSWAFWIVASP